MHFYEISKVRIEAETAAIPIILDILSDLHLNGYALIKAQKFLKNKNKLIPINILEYIVSESDAEEIMILINNRRLSDYIVNEYIEKIQVSQREDFI